MYAFDQFDVLNPCLQRTFEIAPLLPTSLVEAFSGLSSRQNQSFFWKDEEHTERGERREKFLWYQTLDT